MSELLIKLLDSQIYKPFDSLLPDSLYLLYRMSDFILHVHTKKNIQTSHKLITMHLEILREFGMHQMDEEYIMISKVVVRSLTHIVKSFYKSDQRSSIWLTDEEKILISTLTTKLNEDIYKFSKDLIPDIKGLILICQITMKSKPKDINFLNEYKSSKAISNLKNSSSPVYSSNNVSELNESFKSFNLELYEKQ
ncbi:MAG: hypothetical protein MHPSP_002104 [Paramarteilia canceri]